VGKNGKDAGKKIEQVVAVAWPRTRRTNGASLEEEGLDRESQRRTTKKGNPGEVDEGTEERNSTENVRYEI